MARYPTFDEYRKRGNFHDGIKRCDNLLRKNPSDVQLLTVKLQLLYASAGDAQTVLLQLSSLQPPVLDLGEIAAIEDAVENSQRDSFPQPNTAGPTMATLWDNAFKASNSINHKLDLLSLRFSRAVVDDRLLDAQQALIQLKALQPKNRVIYMAHLAVTQLLSASKEDLQSRLALSLARKAVKENFDEDKSLDCRVPGQIFAIQASEQDLESIVNRSFAENKQVHDARKRKASEMNGEANALPSSLDATTVPPLEWLSSEIQSLKLQFARLIAASAPLHSISCFAANSIRLFHTAKTSIPDPRGRGLADSCFLSISALVRIFELSNESRTLLHAAFLADALLKRSPHVHEARLILIYLYMNLGLGSLAMIMFHSLNIKEIQHDTVGHTLFTRLSITHPHSTKVNKRDILDPQKRLSHALTVYTRHEEKLAETEASVLNHEQTGMVFDLRELRKRLRSSMTRRTVHLEQRRIARLLLNAVGEDVAQLGPKLTANWLEISDNRDFAAAFDYGYSAEKVLYRTKNALPGASSILYGLAVDCAWCLARGVNTPVKDVETLLEETSKIGLDLNRIKIDDERTTLADVTRSEILAGDLARQVLKMLLCLTLRTEELKENVTAVLKAVQLLDVDSVLNTKVILTEGIQNVYMYLDVLRIVIKASKHARGKTLDCQAELQELQTLVESKCSALLQHAREQANRVSGAEIQADLERDELVRDTVKMFEQSRIAEFTNSIASSAKEGWEGVMMITVE